MKTYTITEGDLDCLGVYLDSIELRLAQEGPLNTKGVLDDLKGMRHIISATKLMGEETDG